MPIVDSFGHDNESQSQEGNTVDTVRKVCQEVVSKRGTKKEKVKGGRADEED